MFAGDDTGASQNKGKGEREREGMRGAGSNGSCHWFFGYRGVLYPAMGMLSTFKLLG